MATVVGGFLLNRFEVVPLGRWIWTISRWLIYPVPVPLILFVALLACLGLLVVSRTMQRAPRRPPWWTYRQDSFLGVTWRWNYDGDNFLDQRSIGAFCPRCEMRLRAESQGYHRSFTTTMRCDGCHFQIEVDGNGPEVIDQVGRFIEREANKRAHA